MSDKIGKWYTHIHHSGDWFEMLTQPEDVRIWFIKENKPSYEIETRLRLFKPLRGELPVEVDDAWKAYADARKACADARKARDDAWKACADARKARDDAWKACADAWKACAEARKAYDDTVSRHAEELNVLHLAECGPNCPWTPENRTIFPKESACPAR